ncbi:hypothetical protein [Halanaerobaculum tunisiense]
MKNTLAITLFFIVVISWQVRKLVQQKQWRELVVYSLIMGAGVLYSYGVLLDLALPNPINLLNDYAEPVYNYIFKELLA